MTIQKKGQIMESALDDNNIIKMFDDDIMLKIFTPITNYFIKTTSMCRKDKIVDLLKTFNNFKRPLKIVNEIISLLQDQPFFQPISNNYRVLSEVSKKIEYRFFNTNELIYNIKSHPDYFYILLSGTVHLTLPQDPQFFKQTSNSKENKITEKQFFADFLSIKNHSHRAVTEPQIQDNNGFQDKIVRIIENGECFGQMVKVNCLRETKAIAVEPSEVLRLNKKTYEILLTAQLKTENHLRLLFLEEIPLFKQLTSFALSSISLIMEEQHLVYGQHLFQCGDPIQKVYVIKCGSFKLVRKIIPKFFDKTDSKPNLKISSQNSKYAQYLIIQQGQILGDYQTLQMQQTYLQSCLCETQQATVLSIDKKTFLKLLLSEEQSFSSIKELITSKNRWKNTMLSSFLEKRTRDSVMNVFLNDQRRSLSTVSKKKAESRHHLIKEIKNEHFFYNEFNKTIVSAPNKQRFSLSRQKCNSESSQDKNLFQIRTKKKQGIPHGIEDIVQLVRQKTDFQKRFRKQKKIKYLFKFKEEEAPLYIRNRYSRPA